MEGGWIKLHRKLVDNPIFSDSHLLQAFVYCLLMASHKPSRILFKGQDITINEGEFLISRSLASKKLKMKYKMWDRKINVLENLQILTTKKTNKFTLISIRKWNEYQIENDQVEDQQMTNKRPTEQEVKEVRRNISINDSKKYDNKKSSNKYENHNYLNYENPNNTDKVILIFKVLKGYDKNDSQWDSVHGKYIPKYKESAVKLIDLFEGNMGEIKECMRSLKETYDKRGISWTIHTIVRDSLEWKRSR